jgi:hypothetical protein
MLTLDPHARRTAAVTILRAHSDEELERIFTSCTPSVADDCRQYLARYGRPRPFTKLAKAAFVAARARRGADDAF